MKIFKVISPGMLTTIQDFGRKGYRHIGISYAGVMDFWAMVVANVLLGNSPELPVIESTILGPKLETLTKTRVAICGADLSPKVNGNYINMWRVIELKEDDVLSFGERKWGCRAYIAIEGGFVIDKVFGSSSTDVRCNLGGKILSAGDFLENGNAIGKVLNVENTLSVYSNMNMIDVIESVDEVFFSEKSFEDFFNNEFKMTSEFDRTGIRLSGCSVYRKEDEMLSKPVFLGNIQVTHNGALIILCVEAQTVGGYPVIASVITADFPKVAQIFPGQKIKFRKVTHTEAVQKLRYLLSQLPCSHIFDKLDYLC